MKTLQYIANVTLPTPWAHGYQIMKTCEALSRAGMSVSLMVTDKRKESEESPFEHYAIPPCFTFTRLPVIDLLSLMPGVWERLTYVLERWHFLFQVKRRATELRSVDIWYTRDLVAAETLRGIDAAKPLFLELHDDPRSNLARWRRLKHRITGFIVISPALQVLLRNEGIDEQKIMIAPDGFDAQEFSTMVSKADARTRIGIAEDVFLVVYTGHLFPWKGIDSVAPAFPSIPSGSELVIMGGLPEDVKRIQSIAPSSQVRYIERKPHAEVLDWLAAADAALLPTSAKYEIGRLYTSPLKLFEYLAAGLPIVASDVPSSRDILNEHDSVFFRPDDPEDFLQSFIALKNTPMAARQAMSEAARRKARQYTWSERGERIAAFLR